MKRTSLLFFVLAAILFLALAQLMAYSIYPINPLPMTSASSGEEMYNVSPLSFYSPLSSRKQLSKARSSKSSVSR